MTHEERAKQIADSVLGFGADECVRSALRARLHQALIEACNDELARRREVEAGRDRAIRIQSALEVRNAQLESWLEDLENILPVEDVQLWLEGGAVSLEQIRRARQVIDEFVCEESNI